MNQSKKKLKKLSLTIILDAYVTINAIEDFLSRDWSAFRQELLEKKNNPLRVDYRMKKFKNYLQKELEDTNEFLNDPDNIHWAILECDRTFFDETLPKHKRKIEWFRSIDRYPFDHSIFLPPQN